MIDLVKAKEAFKEYVSHYDINDKDIALKYYHSLRVSDLCIDITNDLKLSQEDVLLAGLIGLLHDIGRFEQQKVYHSFRDIDTVDHAYYSCVQLFENNLIRNYIEDNQYDHIIKKAIFAHNKFNIPEYYNERELLFSKIARDTDKIDIFLIASEKRYIFPNTKEAISEGVLKALHEKKLISNVETHTALDYNILVISYIYDLNFDYSYKIIKEHHYIDTIFKNLNIKDEHIKKIVNEYQKEINEYLSNK